MPALASLIHDRRYNKLVRWLRSKRNPQRVASIRRRGFIGVLTRWWQQTCGGAPIVGAEIGVKYGSFGSDVLSHCPFVAWMYAIDPWAEYPADHPDRGRFGYAGRDQDSWDWLYRRAKEILGKHGDRARVWRARSLDAAAALVARVEPSCLSASSLSSSSPSSLGMSASSCSSSTSSGSTLDFVYLDAMHDYESVLADCHAWWPVVRPGGLLCGDDWFPVGNFRRDNVGVSRAVEEFAASVGLPLIGHHRSWFIEKPCG